MKNQSVTVTFFDNQGKVIKQVKRPNWREQMREKQKQMQLFKFIYLDKQGNVLDEFDRPCHDKKHSLELANFILQTSLMRDLHEIKTRKIITLKNTSCQKHTL